MPPKKRKRKAKTPKSGQRQSQRQSVVVNIGSTSKSKPRKSSGRGGLPPPSHAHNLAPTFVTAPQVDYTPLLAMIQHHARPIVEQAPLPVTTTPLSASVQASNAEQMAGEAAIRRAGPTAGNFQPPASEVRFKPITKIGGEQRNYKPVVQPNPQVRPPDPYVTQQLIKSKEAEEPGSGGGIPFAESRPAPPGRPKKETQQAVPVDPRAAAEEPKSKSKAKAKAKAKKSQSEDVMSMLSFKKQGL